MLNLKISAETAIRQITERIDDIKTIQHNTSGLEYYDFIRWCSKTWSVIDGIYGSDDSHSEELRNMALSNCSCNSQMAALILAEAYHSRLLEFIDEIKSSVESP
jgi:protein-disulfide isomerase